MDVRNWSFVNATQSADAPTGPQPKITGAGTHGDGNGMVNVSGATLDVTGEDLDDATQVELLDDAGEVWLTVPATYADGKLTASVDFDGKPSDTGAIRVMTASGIATYNVVYAEH